MCSAVIYAFALSPIGYASGNTGTIIIEHEGSGETVHINQTVYTIEHSPLKIELPSGIYIIQGNHRGKSLSDTLQLKPNESIEVKFKKPKEGTIDVFSSGTTFYHPGSENNSGAGVSIEAALLFDTTVFIGVEPIMLFQTSGIGGFINAGRFFNTDKPVAFRSSLGFGYVEAETELKHRYFTQLKTGMLFGSPHTRAEIGYTFMAGTSFTHRFGAGVLLQITGRER